MLATEIRNNWAATAMGYAAVIPSLTSTKYEAWTIKNGTFYGVAFPVSDDTVISETFAGARFYTDRIILDGGQPQNAVMLMAKSEDIEVPFSALCAELVEPGIHGEFREEISNNPVAWWMQWKELLGNKNVDERVYDALGELMVLEYLAEQGEPAVWNGPDSVTYDIDCDQKYYEVKYKELTKELKELENQSEKYKFEETFDQLTDLSMVCFKDKIARKYSGSEKRVVFDQSYFNQKSTKFLAEYPVILSTTYSIKNCLENNLIYDYIIVDEASQVDLVTGVLAMSCAKNIVIVGDSKQLPNVMTEEGRKTSQKYWREGMSERFNFATQSLLSSAILTWENAKSVLLREHYRCASDIINFCNQKFYDDQLIIMTKSEDEDNDIPALKLYKTTEGNLARNHINQREIDVIKNEILPEYTDKGELDIGIITPYRDQVEEMKKQLPDFCEIDTVHKFQGREKDVIILSSVLNDINDFVNDPNMLNVAVSRAVKSLAVVTSGNKSNEKTYYGDLARYIKYQNYSVVESKTYSVFDMLYKEYYQERKKYLARHKRISEWDSENLMYGVNDHHKAEACFKAAAHAFKQALSKNADGTVLSTKGVL